MEYCECQNLITEFAVLILSVTNKSNDPQSPSYVPSIFPKAYKITKCNHKQQLERYNRAANKKKWTYLKMFRTQCLAVILFFLKKQVKCLQLMLAFKHV